MWLAHVKILDGVEKKKNNNNNNNNNNKQIQGVC